MENKSLYFFFILNKPPGHEVFCEPEPIHYKEINKSDLDTLHFYLEDDKHKEVTFKEETLIFALQLMKI